MTPQRALALSSVYRFSRALMIAGTTVDPSCINLACKWPFLNSSFSVKQIEDSLSAVSRLCFALANALERKESFALFWFVPTWWHLWTDTMIATKRWATYCSTICKMQMFKNLCKGWPHFGIEGTRSLQDWQVSVFLVCFSKKYEQYQKCIRLTYAETIVASSSGWNLSMPLTIISSHSWKRGSS